MKVADEQAKEIKMGEKLSPVLKRVKDVLDQNDAGKLDGKRGF